MKMPTNPTSKRVAIVTGASAGMGKATARRLLSDGWVVYGGARRVEHMSDIAKEGANVLTLDVTDDDSVRAFIDNVLAREGRIDALVNNAGYGLYGPLEDIPLSEARRQFDVNVFGLARMSQLVLPTMRKQRSGTIVNISSMGGKIWTPFGGWYHASKHAVEVFSDVLRAETCPFGINVVVVEPGGIATEWGGIAAENLRTLVRDSAYREDSSVIANVLSQNRGASPDVIARVVSRALKAKCPRHRYAAPFDATALIFLHRWLPDSLWERLIWAMVRTFGRRSRTEAKATS